MSEPASVLQVDRRPCGTCPYRCDTPPGIWHPDEYARLAAWDREMHEQPEGVFLCHHTADVAADPKLCRGWLDVHGQDALGVRIAVALGCLDPAVLDEEPAVEVYESGRAAALAGMGGVAAPSPEAQAAIDRLIRRNERLGRRS